MEEPLFFFQCLLPVCNPKESGIPNDGRMPSLRKQVLSQTSMLLLRGREEGMDTNGKA